MAKDDDFWAKLIGAGLLGTAAFFFVKAITSKPGSPPTIYYCPNCARPLAHKRPACPHCFVSLTWPNPGGTGQAVLPRKLQTSAFWVGALVLVLFAFARLACIWFVPPDPQGLRFIEWMLGVSFGTVVGYPLGVASAQRPTTR